jgi:hypothetical protein
MMIQQERKKKVRGDREKTVELLKERERIVV